MAKKKNVADLAQEALNSAALFADDLTTVEKNSAGDHLPEDFFAPAPKEQPIAAATAEHLEEALTESAAALPPEIQEAVATHVEAGSEPITEATDAQELEAASADESEPAPMDLPEEEPAATMPENEDESEDLSMALGTVESDIASGESLGEDVEDADALDQETEIDITEGEDIDDSDVDENIDIDSAIFLQEEEQGTGFLPDVSDDQAADLLADDGASDETGAVSVEGTELDSFESANIEDVEFVEDERLESIVESILFASDRPVSLASLKLVFKGTNVNTQKIRRTLDQLAVEYAGGRRGVTLEEVPGGYQLRTKIDNMEFMRRTLKARPFKLSGPALEVLSIVAYKQPTVKFEVDEIRGVESGHLLRALMEKNLVCFDGKSDLPGRPMQYGTTKKFLEIFGLRNLKELPTLSQIDELLPEGIGEDDEKEKATLSTITDSMAENSGMSYSQGEDELNKITEQLEEITTSSDFFEQEKQRQKAKRDEEKAQNIREAMAMSEEVSTRDINWLKRYEEALLVAANPELKLAVAEFDAEATSEEGAEAETGSESAQDQGLEGELQAAEDNDGESDDYEEEEELPFLGEADDIGEDDASI